MSRIHHVNPADTYNSLRTRGYTQIVTVEMPRRLIFISGQLPLDQNGTVVGTGDIEAQTRVVFENLEKSLKSVGAELSQIVKLTAFVTDVVKHPPVIRKVRSEFLGINTPPASTMVEVPRFAHPDIMIEIEAICSSNSV
jgi:enamine deaminase RidA (YjgF/YER057c/UK114 family)